MGTLRTAGRTAATVGVAIASASCGSDARDAAPVVGPAPIEATASKTGSAASAAISDAISRLLPSIDPASADALHGPLIAINNQLVTGNAPALRDAIASARAAISVALAVPADGPDVEAISLAVDSVDPATR